MCGDDEQAAEARDGAAAVHFSEQEVRAIRFRLARAPAVLRAEAARFALIDAAYCARVLALAAYLEDLGFAPRHGFNPSSLAPGRYPGAGDSEKCP